MTIAVFGEALIDFIIGDDGAYRPHLGGSPYNVAIGLARQGINASYLSPFSDDSFGDQLRSSLAAEGVAILTTRRSLRPTSLALITVDHAGNPAYRLYRDGVADTDISFQELEANLPANLQVFHTGSLAITPNQLAKIRDLIDLIRERGVIVSVDINIRLGASQDKQVYLDGVRSLIGVADIIKASDEDITALGIHENPRMSAEILFSEMGSGMLVLTEGPHGAVLHSKQGTFESSAYPIAQVKDTIGAGDTFHAAFLAFLYRQGVFCTPLAQANLDTLRQAVDFASAAAALNITRDGCSPPSESEVIEFAHAVRRQGH